MILLQGKLVSIIFLNYEKICKYHVKDEPLKVHRSIHFRCHYFDNVLVIFFQDVFQWCCFFQEIFLELFLGSELLRDFVSDVFRVLFLFFLVICFHGFVDYCIHDWFRSCFSFFFFLFSFFISRCFCWSTFFWFHWDRIRDVFRYSFRTC